MDGADPTIPEGAAVLHPAHSYRRNPPSLTCCDSPDADLLAWFYHQVAKRDVWCPDEYMVRIPDAHVLSGQHILGPAGWVAPSVLDWPAASAELAAQRARIAGGVPTLDSGGRTVAIIGKTGAENYGHALVEILPKLVNLHRSGLQDVLLLLPQGMARFTEVITRLLDRMQVRATLAFEPWVRMIRVQDIAYFGPVSRHNDRKSETLLAFRDEVRTALGVVPSPRRRFYIDRPESLPRSLSNAAEVRAVMEANGYETVEPGGLSFAGQVALLSQASHIAGPLGAGLTNMLWAPKECRVTMFDPGLHDLFFWDLAALAGQPFTWVFAAPLAHFSQELASGRYALDVGLLRVALAAQDDPQPEDDTLADQTFLEPFPILDD